MIIFNFFEPFTKSNIQAPIRESYEQRFAHYIAIRGALRSQPVGHLKWRLSVISTLQTFLVPRFSGFLRPMLCPVFSQTASTLESQFCVSHVPGRISEITSKRPNQSAQFCVVLSGEYNIYRTDKTCALDLDLTSLCLNIPSLTQAIFLSSWNLRYLIFSLSNVLTLRTLQSIIPVSVSLVALDQSVHS